MRSIALLAAVAGLSGCVLSPVDDDFVTSRIAPLTVSGYASAPNARVQIRAWNHARATWELVREVRSGTSAIGRDVSIYGWSTTELLLGDRHWYGPATPTGCVVGSGMGRLEVRELRGTTWATLATFDAAGQDCLGEEIADGADFVAAGNTCRTGENILMFAPEQCAVVPATDATPPRVVLRATDDERAWEVRDGDVFGLLEAVPNRPLRLRVDAFDPQGVALAQADFDRTVTCRRSSGATYPVNVVSRNYGEQSTPVGATVAVSAGGAIDITRASLQAYCGADTVAGVVVDIDGALGVNARGAERRTPGMRFTVTY